MTHNKPCILVLSNDWGGLYSFRKEVFQAFFENGYEVVISCPMEEKSKNKADWFKNIGCKIINTPFNRKGTNPYADYKLMQKYKNLIKQINPVAVLTYTIKPNLYGGMACALCGVPQIANITGLGAAVEYPGLMQKLTIGLYRLGLRKTQLVFFQNDANRQFCISRRMVKGKTKLIPGSGVNLTYHNYKEFPSEDEPIRFIFISRIRREKGIDEYLAAAEALHEKYNTEFHVVGPCEDDYVGRLKALDKKGTIIFHGEQSDVRPFIARAHCMVHPSFYPEGMSNVLLESCAAGRPIITTDRSGCREIVDCGVNGFIVNQKDTRDTIAKVEQFILLPYEQKKAMGIASRKKVEKEFDRQIVIDAYLEAVKHLTK